MYLANSRYLSEIAPSDAEWYCSTGIVVFEGLSNVDSITMKKLWPRDHLYFPILIGTLPVSVIDTTYIKFLPYS